MSGADITCPKYVPVDGSRRCTHYLSNGACARPDELMCVEWLKRNPRAREQATEELGPRPQPEATPSAPPTATTQVLAVRTLTDEALRSFRDLGVEICLATEEAGPVWIVPEYTGQDRRELRVDHAATLAALSSTFPGARVLSFRPTDGTGDR